VRPTTSRVPGWYRVQRDPYRDALRQPHPGKDRLTAARSPLDETSE